jgi:hypothetical protein
MYVSVFILFDLLSDSLQFPVFNCGVVLLLSMWASKRSLMFSTSEGYRADVQKCMDYHRAHEDRYVRRWVLEPSLIVYIGRRRRAAFGNVHRLQWSALIHYL